MICDSQKPDSGKNVMWNARLPGILTAEIVSHDSGLRDHCGNTVIRHPPDVTNHNEDGIIIWANMLNYS